MKAVLDKQYKDIVKSTSERIEGVRTPPEGWIRTVRKALGMSGAALARRTDALRGRVHQAELAELEGAITLKQLQRFADGMDCKLVYAIVPKTSIDEIMANQAEKMARKLVGNASIHMSLEAQGAPESELEQEIQRIKKELLASPNRSLWND